MGLFGVEIRDGEVFVGPGLAVAALGCSAAGHPDGFKSKEAMLLAGQAKAIDGLASGMRAEGLVVGEEVGENRG